MATYEGITAGHEVQSLGRRRYKSTGNIIAFGTVDDDGIFIKGKFIPNWNPLGYNEESVDLSDRVKYLEVYNEALKIELSSIYERLDDIMYTKRTDKIN